jgi:regulator of protease activity HflC (stomatin/prohibitin superfamily)
MDSLEPLQYGITVNKITKTIGTEVYESGRYLIGPFKSFLVYPANLVTIEFSDARTATGDPLQTRTAEGLGLTLYVSFQYEVNKTEIPKLYNMANINYHSTFVRISRDIILKVAGSYNATNYWTDRGRIGEKMKEALDTELKTAFARCRFLQLLRIDLPKSYEDSIVGTQVEVQKTSMRKFEQTAELIRQNISVIISEADQKIRVTNATGQADAYRIKQFATVKIILFFKFFCFFLFFQMFLIFN